MSSMDSITSSVTIRELHSRLADVVGRASISHERVQVTKNGRSVAVLIGLEDFERLEQLEMPRDVAESVSAAAASSSGLAEPRAQAPAEGDLELTSSAAASVLGVSRPTLMKLVRDGLLASRKEGTHHRFQPEDVATLAEIRRADRARAFAELRAVDEALDEHAGLD